MEEIFEIADRITVFRNGQNIGTLEKEKITKNELVKMIDGREISFHISKKKTYMREDQTALLRIE
jgi:ABC-type sugar transport system ATPase subunit